MKPELFSQFKRFLKTTEPKLASQEKDLQAISVFFIWCNTKHLGSYTMLLHEKNFQFSVSKNICHPSRLEL